MFRFFRKTDKNPKEKKTPKHKETDERAEQSLMGMGGLNGFFTFC